MQSENFCVMTVDLKGSKKLRNRAFIQRKVLELIDDLNQKFEKDLQADFVMVLGDEFQGVLACPEKAYQVFKCVKSYLEVEFYCGVGVGNISTDLRKKTTEMDGSAFHRSREALEHAKKEKAEIVIKSHNKEKDKLLNAMINLILHIRKKWTERQSQIIGYLESHMNVTQTEVAKHFSTSKQAISKIVKTTGWRKIHESEKIVDEFLGKLFLVNCGESTKKG